jgi:hypothetical protein
LQSFPKGVTSVLEIGIVVSPNQGCWICCSHLMNDDVTSQQNKCPERNGRHCLHPRLCSPINRRLALAETSFPPRQQPQKGCASVPILVFYQLPPRNEISVDGRKIDPGPVPGFPGNEISGFHAKNNLALSAFWTTIQNDQSVDFFRAT